MPPTASSSSTLFLALSRRQTFHKSRKAASTKHLNWPYPLSGAAAKTSSIHPDRLVEAGFYSTPIDEDATVTTCFACGVVVGMWEEGEDALFRHEAAAEEAGIRCPFATVRRHAWGEEGVDAPGREKENWDEYWGDEGEWHPRGERMNEARRGTFDVGWPHDDDEGGVPTRDEVRPPPPSSLKRLLTRWTCRRSQQQAGPSDPAQPPNQPISAPASTATGQSKAGKRATILCAFHVSSSSRVSERADELGKQRAA
ncbi:hypothetical protein AAT19DRAFT_15082 [Rhodotorula toruloides]|uniref:Uncharacterized protein n=1 Tax=Rhodotorula toruloides TaxID=5286 RepID=A0A2T0A9T2_RHOTO|nr:hypothetical protein AAT19DRAFT_15082 [Rhodotorula toruloides]